MSVKPPISLLRIGRRPLRGPEKRSAHPAGTQLLIDLGDTADQDRIQVVGIGSHLLQQGRQNRPHLYGRGQKRCRGVAAPDFSQVIPQTRRPLTNARPDFLLRLALKAHRAPLKRPVEQRQRLLDRVLSLRREQVKELDETVTAQ